MSLFQKQQIFQSKIDFQVDGASLTDFPITLNILSQDIRWTPVFWDNESDVSLSGLKRSNIRGYDITLSLDYNTTLEPNKVTKIIDTIPELADQDVEMIFYPDASDDLTFFEVVPTSGTQRAFETRETISTDIPTLTFENKVLVNTVAGAGSPSLSGGDADTLNGLTSDQFLRSDAADTFDASNILTIAGKLAVLNQGVNSFEVGGVRIFDEGDEQKLGTTDNVQFALTTVANATAGGHAVNRTTGDVRWGQLTAPNTWTEDQTLSNTAFRSFIIERATADGTASQLTFRKARGSIGSETATQSGDELGYVRMGGHDGTNWSGYRIDLRGVATETFTGTAQGSRFDMYVTQAGTTTRSKRYEFTYDRFRAFGTIRSDGNIFTFGNVVVNANTAINSDRDFFGRQGTFSGVVTAANATADTHLVNRITGDGRWGQLTAPNTWTEDQTINPNVDSFRRFHVIRGTGVSKESAELSARNIISRDENDAIKTRLDFNNNFRFYHDVRVDTNILISTNTVINSSRDYFGRDGNFSRNVHVDGGFFAQEFIVDQTRVQHSWELSPFSGKIEAVSGSVGSETITVAEDQGLVVDDIVKIQRRSGGVSVNGITSVGAQYKRWDGAGGWRALNSPPVFESSIDDSRFFHRSLKVQFNANNNRIDLSSGFRVPAQNGDVVKIGGWFRKWAGVDNSIRLLITQRDGTESFISEFESANLEIVSGNWRFLEFEVTLSSASVEFVGFRIRTQSGGSDDIGFYMDAPMVLVNPTSLTVKNIYRKVASISGNNATLTTSGILWATENDVGSIEVGDEFVVDGNTTRTDRDHAIRFSLTDFNFPAMRFFDDKNDIDKGVEPMRVGSLEDFDNNITGKFGIAGKRNSELAFLVSETEGKIANFDFNGVRIASDNLSGGSDGEFTTAGILLHSDGWLSASNFALGTVVSKLGDLDIDGQLTMLSGSVIEFEPDFTSNVPGRMSRSGIDMAFETSTGDSQFIQWHTGLGTYAGDLRALNTGHLQISSSFGIDITPEGGDLNLGTGTFDSVYLRSDTFVSTGNDLTFEGAHKIRMNYTPFEGNRVSNVIFEGICSIGSGNVPGILTMNSQTVTMSGGTITLDRSLSSGNFYSSFVRITNASNLTLNTITWVGGDEPPFGTILYIWYPNGTLTIGNSGNIVRDSTSNINANRVGIFLYVNSNTWITVNHNSL